MFGLSKKEKQQENKDLQNILLAHQQLCLYTTLRYVKQKKDFLEAKKSEGILDKLEMERLTKMGVDCLEQIRQLQEEINSTIE